MEIYVVVMTKIGSCDCPKIVKAFSSEDDADNYCLKKNAEGYGKSYYQHIPCELVKSKDVL